MTIGHGAVAEMDALLSGKVDVVIGTPPECIDAIRHGCKYLIDFAEYGLNYALGGIAGRRDYIEKNPDITRRFVKAYVEGMHRYRTDREFTVDVQADYSGVADRTIAEETYDLTQPGMPRAPYPVVASLRNLLEADRGLYPRPEVPTPGNLSTTGLSVSWRITVLSIHRSVDEECAGLGLESSFCCGSATAAVVTQLPPRV